MSNGKNDSALSLTLIISHLQSPHAITHHRIFYQRHLDHDAHPGSLFLQLYLGWQPRYKPSGCSTLSPTPLATDWCPPTIGSHVAIPICPSADHFLPGLETNFSALPEAIRSLRSMFGHPSAPPRFRIIRISSHGILGGEKVSICFVICIFVCIK